MKVHEVFAQMEGKEVSEIKVNSYLEFGEHEVTVIFHYAVLNRIVIYLMSLALYEACKEHYKGDDLFKVIFHLPIEASDVETI